MKVIGLTGGIGTGKSTVAGLLSELGIPVIDADRVAREVVEPGTDGLAAIVARFGPEVLEPGGRLDRKRMRERIAADPQARKDLEAITHPRILGTIAQRIAQMAAEGGSAVVVEAALMVETGSYRQYSALIVVSCSPETQLRRVVQRDGMTEEAAKALIATQLPLADKEKVATVVIWNDGDEAALSEKVREAVGALKL